MIGSRTLFTLLGLVVLLTACAPQESAEMAEEAPAETADMTAVTEAVDAMESAYVAAYNAQDAAGIAALFAADGTQAPPEMAALDRAGVEASYAEQFSMGETFDLQVEREDFVASGDMIVSWGRFEATVTPAEGEPWTSTGRYGVVNRKEADGTWKIYRHMFNYETPPPEMMME